MIYIITLKKTSIADIQGILGKELLQTGLFTEITHHCCVSDSHNNDSEQEYHRHGLIVGKTKSQSTDIRDIDVFLKEVEPIIKPYKDTCESTETITALLFADGHKQG